MRRMIVALAVGLLSLGIVAMHSIIGGPLVSTMSMPRVAVASLEFGRAVMPRMHPKVRGGADASNVLRDMVGVVGPQAMGGCDGHPCMAVRTAAAPSPAGLSVASLSVLAWEPRVGWTAVCATQAQVSRAPPRTGSSSPLCVWRV